MNIFADLEPLHRRNLAILFLSGLCFWMSITTMLPILPNYVENHGATTQQVGWVMGSFAIGLLGSRPWLGIMADHQGRKRVVLIGTVIASLAPLGYLTFSSIPLFMAARMVHGISVSAYTTGFSAWAVDCAPPNKKGELLGYMSLVVPVGMSIGPALGGYLQAVAGYPAIFLAAVGGGCVATLLAYKARYHQFQSPQQNAKSSPASPLFWGLLCQPALGIPTFVLLQVGVVFGTLVAFLPLYIRQSEIALNAGLFYTVVAFGSFLSRLVCGPISDRYGRGLLISVSLICYGGAMVVLAQATMSSSFLLAAFMEGLGRGMLLPMILVLVADRFVAALRGRVYSLCLGGFDLGCAIAGPLLGGVASVSFSQTFLVAASLVTFALGVFVTQNNQTVSLSWQYAIGRGHDYHARNVSTE